MSQFDSLSPVFREELLRMAEDFRRSRLPDVRIAMDEAVPADAEDVEGMKEAGPLAQDMETGGNAGGPAR